MAIARYTAVAYNNDPSTISCARLRGRNVRDAAVTLRHGGVKGTERPFPFRSRPLKPYRRSHHPHCQFIELPTKATMSSSLTLFVLALVLGYSSASSPCPEGWRYSPFTSKCYKLFSDKTSWTTAEYKCAFQGAHHISVHDATDNQFVAELARQANIVWLGAVQYGTDREYTWADHTPFGSFENWENGRRPTYHKGKKCSKFDGITGKWIQSCCKVPAAFICSKPAAVLPDAIIEDDTGINEDFRRTRLAFRRRV